MYTLIIHVYQEHSPLQVLISGAEVPIDINDLRANTKYAGKFTTSAS